ncbi:MAG: ABC transporter permease subunit [Dehalococcoidia bacterium]|nr:ABC transporter permease subunit [Dehalococcoidia bacterium]
MAVTAPSAQPRVFTSGRAARTARWLVRFIQRDPVGISSGVVLVVIVLASFVGPMFLPYQPNALGDTNIAAPSLSHLAGTDQYGRDVFTRTLYGGRTSLTVGFVAAFVGSAGALGLALVFTYAGGKWDYVWNRIVDVNMALPGLVLLLVLVTIFGPSVFTIAVILGVRAAITGTRVMRSVILSTKTEDYILGAVSLGASPVRVMVRHIVPNVIAVSIVTSTLAVGGYITAEASLSFLGLGVQPPTPTWGGMMSIDGRAYILRQPWMLIAPATMLTLTVITANMFGDFLRDTMDPRLRGASGRRGGAGSS